MWDGAPLLAEIRPTRSDTQESRTETSGCQHTRIKNQGPDAGRPTRERSLVLRVLRVDHWIPCVSSVEITLHGSAAHAHGIGDFRVGEAAFT